MKKKAITGSGALVAAPAVVSASVWISENFAPRWFEDALAAARAETTLDSARREIVFAACFAECYIFEWARSSMPIHRIFEFFPPKPRMKKDPRYRRSLVAKWREVPVEMAEEGYLVAKPSLDLVNLGQLVELRNGLVHAAASYPLSAKQPQGHMPFPPRELVEKCGGGWSLNVVVSLVRQLHASVKTSPPEYVVDPK